MSDRLGEFIVLRATVDAWCHNIARSHPFGIEAVPRQSFADKVTVGDHADQPIVLSDRNGTDIMVAQQFGQFGKGCVWSDPVDALMHRFLYLHGGPPLFAMNEHRPHPTAAIYNRLDLSARSGTP